MIKYRIFYGYWIVAVAFLCVFVFSGCGFYSFSLFVKPLQTDLGWSRSEIMAAYITFFLVMGLTSPLAGRLVDRYGPKKVISIGAVVGGLGFILLAQVYNLWHYYLGYAVVGIGMAAMGTVPSSSVVSNWFEKRRGLAIGIMSTGVGVGGLVLVPLVGNYLIPNFGWRAAYLSLALLMWTLIPLVLLVVRTKPSDMGLYPDGTLLLKAVTEIKISSPVTKGISLKMSLATSTLWLIMTSFVLNGFCQNGVIQNQVPHLDDIRFPLSEAVAVLSIIGLWSAIGKFGFGWLCDKIQAKYANAIGLFFQMLGLIAFINVGPTSSTSIIWLYAVFMGLGIGGWLPTMSMLVSSNFGLVSYGAIFGVITFAQYFGGAAGPFIAGYIYDTTNSYYWAFTIFLASYVVAILATLIMRRIKMR
ncbi:MFS transporter [Chloroflexota bacterium]